MLASLSRFGAFCAAVALGIVLTTSHAPGQLTTLGVGSPKGASAPSYTGPGDIVSGAKFWGGLRAYTAAIAAAGTQPLVNIVRASDSHTCDVQVASNGGFGLTSNCSTGGDNGETVATWGNATTLNVITLYDQSGADNCSGAPCNLTQPTGAKRPSLNLSCIGSLPCMAFSGSQSLSGPSNTSFASTSYSLVGLVSSSQSSAYGLTIGFSTGSGPYFLKAGPAIDVYQTVDQTPTTSVSFNTTYAINVACNLASTILYVNGTSNSVTTGAVQNITTIAMGNDGPSDPLVGNISEGGIWPTLTSSGNLLLVNNNQRAYWGF